MRISDWRSDVCSSDLADRIGSDADNDRLSAARARNVRRYLEGRGIDGQVIVAEGHGEREPMVACEREQGAALVDCLAPNRRVALVLRLLQIGYASCWGTVCSLG